jgi:hypothetical protein
LLVGTLARSLRKNLKSDPGYSRLLALDPVVEFDEADEIARRILTRQSVSDDEFRYVAIFNLTVMTQLLWELSSGQRDSSKKNLGPTGTRSESPRVSRGVKAKIIGLIPLAAVGAFLAGLGLGYLIP